MSRGLLASGSVVCGYDVHARDLAAAAVEEAAPAAPTQAPPPVPKSASADAPGVRVATLPLEPGYYVASDTPCRNASNATLSLLQRTGIGGARDFCGFTTIEQTGPDTYRVTQSCQEFQGGGDTSEAVVTYVLSGKARFVARSDQGWSYSARRCSPSTLPAEWHHIRIEESSR